MTGSGWSGDGGNVVNNLVALGAKISVASGIIDEFNVVLLSDYGKGLLTQIPTMERENGANDRNQKDEIYSPSQYSHSPIANVTISRARGQNHHSFVAAPAALINCQSDPF